ncbi:NAD(P)/FAD-dependent oxidoreductase [Geosporobacter ferrireducens]|uniref:FAD-dependent oxidoreductase n=1 Tax=Geosporobacter ferrireducens TaxID=1424294 RepID=A0A1D8GII0_9FIRM|nr:FAD-dependent oxidoreductase [Geosporobacter ferrireducens]AOT70743.1 FAD-dependent oxidoreductase [Geosporobacter ferrireducens]MTI57549.1 FAD-dependent oxidoreductase [Geosporobacter ferrireducens]
MRYDVMIVGAGPSGIFTALELIRQKPSCKILIIEKGSSIDKRSCPKEQTKKCVSCKPYCHITTGFSGAGAFSDGKLSLSYEVGGDLPALIGSRKAQEYIEYTDKIYLEFGADPKVEGLENNEQIKEIRRKAIEAGLKLVDCPIRHLGTEKAQEIYLKIQNYLMEAGVEIRFNTAVEDLYIEDGIAKGVKTINARTKKEEEILYGDQIIVASGRKGADWLKEMCIQHDIHHSSGTVDIGVRVEVRNEVMEKVNNVLYESKLIGYPEPFRNKVRTFCQNPGGFVSQENYDNDLAIVNGHSYKDRKSENTNLAILSSHNFSEPFNQPIQYGKKVAELMNMLGNGKILVQRYGDILDGKRTWQHELAQSNVEPTLPDAVAGDITSAIPYRPMVNILNFIKSMNTVVPGFASRETLLYGPEIKFYSNKINLNEDFQTNIRGLYCLGDSSGWTRGLMMASVMGVLMGQMLAEMHR